MFSKAIVIAAAGVAAVSATCTNPTQFAGTNPVLSPDTATYPTIGQPFTINWDNSNMGPTVTLVLLDGCPSNCIVVETIVGGASNTGSYSWTPQCSLTADTTTEAYGIQLIDDTLCEFQWSMHFGLSPAPAGVCTAPSSPTSSPTATSTATSTPSPAGSGSLTPSVVVSRSVSQSHSSGSSPTGSTGGSGNGGNNNTTYSALPPPTGTYSPPHATGGAGSNIVISLGGAAIALGAAVLMI